MKTLLAFASAAFGALPLIASPIPDPSPHQARAGTPGFYRTVQQEGRWDLLDPEGNLTLSKGVCSVKFDSDQTRSGQIPYAEAAKAKYGSIGTWRQAVSKNLAGWGFNTLGAWSDPEIGKLPTKNHLARTVNAGLGYRFYEQTHNGKNIWLEKDFPDVFDPNFQVSCRKIAREICFPQKNDPDLLGWFTDNELCWGELWKGPQNELLIRFLNLPPKASGRAAAFEFLKNQHRSIADFNTAWHAGFSSWTEVERWEKFTPPPGESRRKNPKTPFIQDCETFLSLVASHYFRTVREAILAEDPNHLLLGCRFAYPPEKPVLEAAGNYMDVISCNIYRENPSRDLNAYASVNKPILIGEFYFRAKDSGLPNQNFGPPTVETQKERCAGFENYVRTALRYPQVIGYHWFQYVDQPGEGRFDGENSNCGVVDIHDQPYDLLVKKMKEINAEAETLHKASSRKP